MRLAVASVVFALVSHVPATGAAIPVDAGLKQALSTATDRAIDIAGVPDGFLHNESIKIPMPERLHTMEKALRMAKQDKQIEEFVVSMNRAAEQAAPAARALFQSSIAELKLVDAKKVLKAGNTGATDYFRTKESAKLTAAFRPLAVEAMEHEHVVEQYHGLAGHFKDIPFAKSRTFDISDYVVTKTMDGIFYVLGLQEEKIRTDPAARTTPLLREVFEKH